MRGRSRRQRSSRCCCSAIQCASRSLTGASTAVCMPVCLRKTIRASLLPGTSKNKRLQSTHERYPYTLITPTVKLLSPLEDRTTLEQMYLITAPKISVFAPNCWETLTEFSCHNSTSHRKTRSMCCNNSVAKTSKVTTFYSIFVLGLYLTTGLKHVSAALRSSGSRNRQPEANMDVV